MEDKKKKLLLLAGLLLVLIAITSYFISSGLRGPSETKIGFISPLSGDLAKLGGDISKGVELFESQHSEIKVIYEDDAFVPRNSLNAYRKLRDIDGADLIIGPLGPSGTNTIYEAMNQEDKDESFLFPITLCTEDFKRYENVLCSYPSLEEQVRANLDFALEKNKKKIYLIIDKSPLGEEAKGYYEQNTELNGQELVGVSEIIDISKESNFYTYATKIKESGADAVVISTSPGAGVFQLIKNIKEQDVDALLILGSDLEEDYAKEFSSILEDVYIPALIGDNFVDNFESDYEKKFGERPNLYNALGYELAAASYYTSKDGKVTRKSLAKKVNEKDYAIIGFSYDSDYMAQIPFEAKVVKNGVIVEV